MGRIIIIVLSIIVVSCSSNQQNDKNSLQVKDTLGFISGLHPKFMGEWINSSYFDSTLTHRQLSPWLTEFYAHVLLSITKKDTFKLVGNMETIDNLSIKIIDSLSFLLPGINSKPVFTYLPADDLIKTTIYKNRIILFRRIQKKDEIEIVADRKKFNDYFINKFFTEDFFKDSKKPEFIYLWNGFETHTPFNFDAVRIKNQKGEDVDLAWKIKGDTLEFYNTSRTFNEDGSPIYKIESLNKRYIKK